MTHVICAPLEPLESRRLLTVSVPGDMVLRWNDVAMDVLRDSTLPGPGWSSRNLAITSLAIFDAVNSIDRSYRPYLHAVPGFNGGNTSMEAAIASAAHDALVALYPEQRAFLDAELSSSLATVPDGPKETRGVQLGQKTARAMLQVRRSDGSDRVTDYTVNPDPGHWEPDPVNPEQLAWGPGWGNVRPFALHRPNQFQAPPPPALDSDAYAAAYNEVKDLGALNSPTRTADQTEMASFWAYDRAGMGTPPGMYCQQIKVIAIQEGNTQVENARLFALANMAQADAGFAAWNSKFEYDLWRPVTAIRRGAEDGNPLTEADPTWVPLGAPGGAGNPAFTPPFPAYVSGHATFGAAVYKTLANFYGTDQISFTLTSDEMPGVARSFTSLSQAAAENGRSRVYMGVHWNYDDTFGQQMGRNIADFTFARELEPRVHQPGHAAKRALGVATAFASGGDASFSSTAIASAIGLSNDGSDDLLA